MSNSAEKPKVFPAALALLAIYNPSLSQNDDTVGEQIVYYYTKSNAHGSHHRKSHTRNVVDQEQKNEELRQIGLAQGMVQFARQSVDLTRIITMSEPETSDSPSRDTSKTDIEYSAREVSPTALLLEQLMQAHQVFLLHHAQTLTELLARLQRPKFCAVLERFWDDFVGKWDVLLHGHPITDILGGLKLAAGGELGIGVGEEEWGSGEREVLEGFIRRTDGLMDLIVSRFGESAVVLGPDEITVPGKIRQPPLRPIDWHLGQDPQPSDGVIFSGIGVIARPSVKQVSRWVESLFTYGEGAYGVRENPVAVNRRRPNRSSPPSRGQSSLQYAATKATMRRSTDSGNFGIPAPIVGKHKMSRDQQQQTSSSLTVRDEGEQMQPASTATKGENGFKTDTLMKYMTLGIYGSGLSASLMGYSGQPPNRKLTEVGRSGKSLTTSSGYFLVGLHGDLDEETGSDDNAQDFDSATGRGIVEGKQKAQSSRIAVRTLVVEEARKESMEPVGKESRDFKAADTSSYCRLRVVVYVNRPFIFTFLFEPQTDGLAMPSFYRSLHHQLGPLQRPLLKSTSPSRVSERVLAASAPKSTVSTRNAQPIFDLVYDPYNVTVHTTIPNIPEPGSTPQSTATGQTSWTRVEALSVHSQMLNTYSSTRGHESEVERTCKNNRGWWVVWMRLPHVAASQQLGYMVYREAFLLRKANDIGAAISKTGRGIWGRSTNDSSAGNGGASSRLVEGIGIDARQYIEGLAGLNR
ncbi:MAG: hypothetical protein Q9215_006090 [Flavoplaca cf. flavocitrina]